MWYNSGCMKAVVFLKALIAMKEKQAEGSDAVQ